MQLRAHVHPVIVGVVSLTLITGGLFPLALGAFSKWFFPRQAQGSLLTNHGVVVGSRWIGQAFSRPEYFHPRPSAGGAGYDGLASGGTNLGPSNPKLLEDVRKLASAYRADNHLPLYADVPIDAVTRSGSGLDPQISPANAALQVARVARARGTGEGVVRKLLAAHTEGRQLGFLGNARVSVLALNLALDQAVPIPPHQ